MIVKFITLKWGTKYGPEYVNRLHNSIKQTYSGEFEFHCFTDDPTGLNCITWDISLLPHHGSKVFTIAKIDLFDKLPFDGPYAYLDLDMLVLKDLKPYFDEYKFIEPRMIYCYWQYPPRIWASFHRGDCYINSSFTTWDNNQLSKLHVYYTQYFKLINHKFTTFDKFVFHNFYDKINYHPKGIVYAYSFGAEYPDDLESNRYRDGYYIAMFNTSHGKGTELHEAEGWAKSLWENR